MLLSEALMQINGIGIEQRNIYPVLIAPGFRN
jgi:hypothetical protein